jgi:hypothetical protein
MVCKELEEALRREQKAEKLLYEQNSQLEEMSETILRYSNNDSFKLNQVNYIFLVDFKLFYFICVYYLCKEFKRNKFKTAKKR